VLPQAGVFGVKTLTGYPGRRAPTETYFALLLFDARDGALRAVMAANHLTGVRTGAATAVAAKYLARPDAAVVGLFGAGVQSAHQIAGLVEVRAIELVKVFDLDRDKATAFARRMEETFGVRARPAMDAREIVAGSDLVVTATTARTPVYEGEWLEPGTHVSGVGANAPSKRELDDTTFRRSKVVVDFREQALDEAGDLQGALRSGAIGPDAIHAELGEIVAGHKAGRQSPTEITLFKSVGVAIEDIAAAAFVYEQALAKGLGTPLPLNGDPGEAIAPADAAIHTVAAVPIDGTVARS
jgi:alanine dehydrogenase